MSRKLVLGICVTIWALADILFEASLKPLISQTIFAGTALYIHWSVNK